MREVMLGSLRARLTGGSDREGGGDGPVVVLLHGFGAPGTDLVPLWRQLQVPREVRFVFPEAPLDLAAVAGPGYAGARAWWMIDLEAMQRAAAGGPSRDRALEKPEGLPEARDKVLGLLDAIESELGADGTSIVLGGFSQGAMLALDAALHAEGPLAALLLMSSTLICADEWTARLPARAGLRVLQSHGRADPLLPFAAAERLRDVMRGAGLTVEWVEFNGGHAIADSVLDAAGGLIAEVLKDRLSPPE